MKKDNNILIIANCTWYLYNFRKELLEELNNKGYKLILLSTIESYYHCRIHLHWIGDLTKIRKSLEGTTKPVWINGQIFGHIPLHILQRFKD